MGHNTAAAQASELGAPYDDAYIFKEGRSAQKAGAQTNELVASCSQRSDF